MPSEVVPPEEIQTIIDKTASFVAKLGEEFEKRIFENEKDNPKFSFLKFNDQYFPWYQKRIRDFRIELGLEKPPAPPQEPKRQQQPQPQPPPPQAVPAPAVPLVVPVPVPPVEEEVIVEVPQHAPTTLAQRVMAVARRNRSKPIEQPPPELFIQDIPEDMTAQDLDIVKLTAQFVAKNGHQFQIGLMNREHRNPQFDFLKQNHHWNNYFLGLVEAYTRCLLPPKNICEKLRSEYNDKQVLLDRAIAKHQYEKQIERAKQAEEKKKEQENLANSMIDWHDFVVVETIDFYEEEDLPIAQYETENAGEAADMEMEVDEPQKQPQVQLKKDYQKPTEQPPPAPAPRPPASGPRPAIPIAPPPGVPLPPGLAASMFQKTEDQLIPEDQFLANNQNPATITIQLPVDNEKPEWKLQGQTISLQCNLKDTIQQVKEKIAQQIGMPANKQKLRSEYFSVLKDGSTLAYYNIPTGSVLTLSVKARGGKK